MSLALLYEDMPLLRATNCKIIIYTLRYIHKYIHTLIVLLFRKTSQKHTHPNSILEILSTKKTPSLKRPNALSYEERIVKITIDTLRYIDTHTHKP